ncbi:PadR family transcriptional regulator [Actinoplanes sp. NEAU-A12]|uniref:PadR family transcriptional regulator n=1 Tax=Actinoplanes sandaracinus TaxID=3045177 RepID=A0ABT6WSK1_9ACTN|nr:PadR family transcriptional regulator [Actinoplanes sandaracinus]MDI6102651.1 PadR family transcriptional regulator [Actinoplanes sandaracinus]
MRETTFFILATLQDGPLHGYAIIQRASALSRGRIKLATGTLYTALERLTGAGHIRVADEQVVNGRARRTYELTPSGGAALREHADLLASAARVVTERRATRPVVRPA